MYKNIAIVLLACCCIYLVVSQRMERNAWEERPLGAAAYGGLIALRDVLPPAEYQKEVVPFLERAAAEGHASYRQLQDLDDKLRDLGNQALEAARKARCYDFVMALPDGFDTVIGEGGASLSGGERQRISIARCILKDAPIVILDEATASVDADNESYIQQAISELVQGKTLLVIAHRLNTIRGADQILVISDGEIAQRGTHQSLMEEDGIYRNFVTVRQQSRGWNRKAGA